MTAAVTAMARRSVEPVPSFAEAFGEVGRRAPDGGAGGMGRLRAESFERFVAAGFPTSRAEDWKYTNVAKVANVPLVAAAKAAVGLDAVSPHLAGGHRARRLIFVNGHVVPEFSHVESLPAGVRVMSLARALGEMPERVRDVLAEAADDRALTALNAAFAGGGAWIELADGAELEEPLQVLYLTVGQPAGAMSHPRNVVRLGAGSRLRLIEGHVALAGGGAGERLTNLVSQVRLGDGASLEHDVLQLLHGGSTLIGKSFAALGTNARYRQTGASLGGVLARNEHEIRLQGEGIECTLNGTYMPRGREQIDNLIRIHHERPNCLSNQFYKGVVDERAHAVFAGKIIVHKDAQKTNAYQKNDNLLLSDDAEVDTKPELEIYADDVKCSHGATVADLDPRSLFYLRSRGLDKDTAASLLTFAFAAEVIERFGDETVRMQARQAVAARLPGGGMLGDIGQMILLDGEAA